MSRIVITGIGVISALGEFAETNHTALVKAECGLSSLQLFKTIYSETLKFGEIKIENEQLKNRLGIKNKGITRTSLLALHALNEAVNDSKLKEVQIKSYDTALIVANTVGGMCLTDELFQDANSKDNGSEYVSSYDCGSTTLFLQNQLGVKGVCNTINTACSSSANALMFAARLINNGYANRAIVGGVDSLAKFTINGFNSLGILAPQNCKPFDKNRNGLNLGEGSGFIVMEKESDVIDKKIYAVLSGYFNSNDAFHPSALSDNGDGPFLAMKGALKTANLSPFQIGYVNTHGTGTENNDEVEGKALKRIFETVPPFASTKSKIGHCLGGAAAIESVFSIIALNNQEIYPSLNFITPIESTGLIPLLEYKNHSFDHIMTNSFGFGGNCSSLIFSKK
jgi:3-oxoacyl-(acyl-carrier-protein) synthase